MSLVLTHFAVGAIATAILVHLFFPSLRYKMTVIVGGGIWALIPDLHGITPVYTDVFYALDTSRWADLFWFHRTMDRLEVGAGSPRVALVFAGALVIIVALGEWYEKGVRCNDATGDTGDGGT
ncbi:hypothetical protein CV102_22560 [Natronococcus pandeyae]|uniref:Uncharacterized protein n=2 Tax=Natronococcus pandeyae TaxID=2055836 RepID=A0A8J8PXR6_9EURY|nr:hypothetical protein CV102_22560 [Natronococcus pandeyae]